MKEKRVRSFLGLVVFFVLFFWLKVGNGYINFCCIRWWKCVKGRIIAWISLGLLPSLFLCRGRPTPNKPCCSSLRGKDSLDPPSCFGQRRKLERKSVLYGSWSLTISYLVLSLPVLLIIWIFQMFSVIILASLVKHFLKEAGRKQSKDLWPRPVGVDSRSPACQAAILPSQNQPAPVSVLLAGAFISDKTKNGANGPLKLRSCQIVFINFLNICFLFRFCCKFHEEAPAAPVVSLAQVNNLAGSVSSALTSCSADPHAWFPFHHILRLCLCLLLAPRGCKMKNHLIVNDGSKSL